MMTDNFALLHEPRRPWLDPDALKQKFLALSAETHPDRAHNAPEPDRLAATARFTELNAAYNCLREPKDRLRHLLELETGAKPADLEQVPAGAMDAFMEAGMLCKQTDAFLAETAGVTSPLLKVQVFERAQAWSGKLAAAQRNLAAGREALLAELKGLNAAWESSERAARRDGPLPLERLEQIYRLLGYHARWIGRLQETIVRLSF